MVQLHHLCSCYCIVYVYHLLVEYFYSFFVSSFTVHCVLCMRVCLCVLVFVYGLLPDSNKDCLID